MVVSVSLFFFFQAEDGIRDLTVTGVQTCALPILRRGDRHAHRILNPDGVHRGDRGLRATGLDRKSTRLNSSHSQISYAVFCLKKKKQKTTKVCIQNNMSTSRSGPRRRSRVPTRMR